MYYVKYYGFKLICLVQIKHGGTSLVHDDQR